MISILPTVAPAAAGGINSASLDNDGQPIPFAHLLGLAVETVPPAATVVTLPADATRQQKTAEPQPSAPVGVEILFPYNAAPATVIAPPVTTPSASAPATAMPAVEAKGPIHTAATAMVNANDAAAASNPAPAEAAPAPTPNDVPAPMTRPEPAVEREARAESVALQSLATPGKTDLANPPDAPAMPSTVSAAAPASAVEPPAFHARVAAPVHAAEFPREFASQVHIAVQRGVEQASIAVHPPQLGPIEVRLEVSNGEARLHFAADSAATREAIADAMPKLRDMLGSQGLTLSGSTVGAELPQREQPGAPRDGNGASQSRGAADSANDAPAAAATSTLRLVDVFA